MVFQDIHRFLKYMYKEVIKQTKMQLIYINWYQKQSLVGEALLHES